MKRTRPGIPSSVSAFRVYPQDSSGNEKFPWSGQSKRDINFVAHGTGSHRTTLTSSQMILGVPSSAQAGDIVAIGIGYFHSPSERTISIVNHTGAISISSASAKTPSTGRYAGINSFYYIVTSQTINNITASFTGGRIGGAVAAASGYDFGICAVYRGVKLNDVTGGHESLVRDAIQFGTASYGSVYVTGSRGMLVSFSTMEGNALKDAHGSGSTVDDAFRIRGTSDLEGNGIYAMYSYDRYITGGPGIITTEWQMSSSDVAGRFTQIISTFELKPENVP